jgi:hypothetical protein
LPLSAVGKKLTPSFDKYATQAIEKSRIDAIMVVEPKAAT